MRKSLSLSLSPYMYKWNMPHNKTEKTVRLHFVWSAGLLIYIYRIETVLRTYARSTVVVRERSHTHVRSFTAFLLVRPLYSFIVVASNCVLRIFFLLYIFANSMRPIFFFWITSNPNIMDRFYLAIRLIWMLNLRLFLSIDSHTHLHTARQSQIFLKRRKQLFNFDKDYGSSLVFKTMNRIE